MTPANLVGTWSLASFEGRRASGEVFHPWGKDARGRLSYDESGHVALQLTRSGRARFASDDLDAGTPEERLGAFAGYHAWFGRYEIDADGTTVIHHVEASLFPNWEGREQRRVAHRGGAELVLHSLPIPYGGEPVEFVTRWIRADRPSRSPSAAD